MTALGTLPTKTDVQITISGSGENATIRAATPGNAGVMTAEHARVVETVRLMLAAGQFEAPAAVPLGQQASTLPLGDLSLPPPKQQVLQPLQAGHSDDLLRRIQALEARSTSNAEYASLTAALTTLRDSVAKRIDSLEARVTELEHAVVDSDNSALKQEVALLQKQVSDAESLRKMLADVLNDDRVVMIEHGT